MAPATSPIRIADAGGTNAQAPLPAASPATQPLAVREASGLPNRRFVTTAVAKAAAPAPNIVFTAISGNWRGSMPLNRIAAAEFNPVHPIHASRQPNRTSTALCPGIAVGIPSLVYLPRRGPTSQTITSAVRPPTA